MVLWSTETDCILLKLSVTTTYICKLSMQLLEESAPATFTTQRQCRHYTGLCCSCTYTTQLRLAPKWLHTHYFRCMWGLLNIYMVSSARIKFKHFEAHHITVRYCVQGIYRMYKPVGCSVPGVVRALLRAPRVYTSRRSNWTQYQSYLEYS